MEVVQEAVELHPRAVMQLGVLLLILTPVVRVAFTVLVFLAQRDVKFVAVTVFVLAVLLLSLLGRGCCRDKSPTGRSRWAWELRFSNP